MRPSLPVLFLILGLFASGVAQDSKSGLGTLSELPPHLRFEEGKLNLVVDYAAAKGKDAPLYIVNDTDAVQPFLPLHPIVRETLGDDGQWRRCEPSDPGPWCGVGLPDPIKIPSSGFLRAHIPVNADQGELRTIRFREYVQNGMSKWTMTWTSNEGLGLVDPAAVDASRFDYIGASLGPFEDVARIALKQVPPLERADLARKFAFVRLVFWNDEPRRIDLLKQVITTAVKEDSDIYRMALSGLITPSLSGWTEVDCWKFLVAESNSGRPLSSLAFESLLDADVFPKRKRALLDQIIANPRHPNLASAIRVYPKIAGNAATIKMAQRVSRSSKYPESVRAAGYEILAKLAPGR